jgi:hypothetical protein
VVGDGGLVLPLELDAWSGIPEMVEARRSDLVARGLDRARRFTLQASGADLRRAYEGTLS